MNRTFLAAGIGLVLILAGCGTEKAAGHRPVTSRPHSSAPPTFVSVLGQRPHRSVSLLSALSGKVVHVLTPAGSNFTNNGLARSPDGRWIYATWIGKHSLRIERVASTGGPRTFIANGSEPAISPDGRYLAYASAKGSQSVAVLDLNTSRTRLWNLRPIVGKNVSLLNGEILWLGSGELVVRPGRIVQDVTGTNSENSRTKAGECGPASGKTTCLVYFDPRKPHPKVQHVVVHPGGGYDEYYSAGTNAPHSVVMSRLLTEKTEFDLIELPGGHRTHLATVPGMALALDRSGTHLLYLIGHSPPALWSAQLQGGHLIDRHRIMANSQIAGGIVW